MNRRRRRLLWLAIGLAAVAWLAAGPIAAYLGVSLRWQAASRGFLAEPYLQLGDAPGLADPERVEVVWHAADSDDDWWVDARTSPGSTWVRAPEPSYRRVRLAKVEPHRVYHATIAGLVPGGQFAYRVGKGLQALFEAEGRARVPAGTPHRVVLVGDAAAGTSAASKIAWRIGQEKADLLVVTGDIVYSRGRIAEYGERFFPVYNTDHASPARGAPILRSTLSVAAPGNHDLATRDLASFPDALAYFFAWSLPLNGPLSDPDGPNVPSLFGPPDRCAAYKAAAGPVFPRMANFSFDCGDVHWTVLDANQYVDWTNRELREWVERDLASASGAAWRLVAFHQPGFNSSVAHFDEQQMRLLADVFEHGGAAVAFGGHVHEYQRTKPLTFRVRPQSDGKLQAANGRVDGEWALDTTYDGVRQTTPHGVLYVITGGGGATLHDTRLEAQPATWQPFTERVRSTVHSYTVMDVARDRLDIRQVDSDGKTIDSFAVTRPAP
jgi:3',5'-cyclic AMP phosphodiesterase CpdA